jgi:hypothetical protein
MGRERDFRDKTAKFSVYGFFAGGDEADGLCILGLEDLICGFFTLKITHLMPI